MNTSHSATSAVPADLLPVIELRQYTLVPGQRETLIDIFDGNFVEPQDAAGMTVIGQFRDLDRPDMFVWRWPLSMTARCGRRTAMPPMRQ